MWIQHLCICQFHELRGNTRAVPGKLVKNSMILRCRSPRPSLFRPKGFLPIPTSLFQETLFVHLYYFNTITRTYVLCQYSFYLWSELMICVVNSTCRQKNIRYNTQVILFLLGANVEFRKLCVLGLGYIGLPTASTFATHGLQVVGVDINQQVVSLLKARRPAYL